MLHKKTFKILSVLVAIIIAFSLFCIPVSAVSNDSSDSYTFLIQKPEANSNSGYIEFITENWGPMLMYFSVTWNTTREDINDGGFSFLASIHDNQLFVDVLGIYGVNNSSQYCDVSGFVCTSYGWSQWGTDSTYLNSNNTLDYYPYSFFIGNAGRILYARGYNVDLSRLGVSSEFSPFIYGSETVLYNQLNEIQELLKQNNSGFQSVIGNANSNADEIQANADKNASQIQQNQDKNTDKVVNGWEQEKEIDTSTTDEYAAKDKELQSATEQGRSSAVSVFNSFGSLFQSDGHLYKGLLAVSAVFTEFMKVDWLSSLLNFSLAIGIFAFVIGTGSEIFKSSFNRSEERKIDKIDSYDERWLM